MSTVGGGSKGYGRYVKRGGAGGGGFRKGRITVGGTVGYGSDGYSGRGRRRMRTEERTSGMVGGGGYGRKD